ncbi:unnamed protein product, partial [Nezara viridula]
MQVPDEGELVLVKQESEMVISDEGETCSHIKQESEMQVPDEDELVLVKQESEMLVSDEGELVPVKQESEMLISDEDETSVHIKQESEIQVPDEDELVPVKQESEMLASDEDGLATTQMKQELLLLNKGTSHFGFPAFNKMFEETKPSCTSRFGFPALNKIFEETKPSYLSNWNVSLMEEMTVEIDPTSQILKLCEDFDVMENIFCNKTNIPLAIHDPVIRFLTDSPSPFSVKRKRKRLKLQLQNSTSYLPEVRKVKMVYLREKLDIFKTVEERKLKLIEDKIIADREIAREQLRLREMEINYNFQLNRLRLER